METRKLWLKLRLKKTAENIKNVIFQPNPSQISYFKQIWGSFEKWSVFGLPLQGGGGNPKLWLKLRLKKTAENIKNVIFQPNPSQISYFKQIWGSLKNGQFLACPYREGVGTRKLWLKLRLKKTAENIKNVMF